MHILRIEHAVPDFGAWKKAFDSDPIGRAKMGVRRYRVLRPVDDQQFVSIDLEFDTASAAEACLAALRQLWQGAGSRVMVDPKVRIVEVVENRET